MIVGVLLSLGFAGLPDETYLSQLKFGTYLILTQDGKQQGWGR
jgi:hypothetical protein